MGCARNWTQEEIDYLCDKYGTVSIKTIAENLNRSEHGIIVKVRRLKLGPFLNAGEYITFNSLLKTLGVDSGGYKLISWVKNRQFPVKTKIVQNNRFRVVYLDDFWKWAERNQDILDFSKFEPLSLGKEPEWANEKRMRDEKLSQRFKTGEPWTVEEDKWLQFLLKQQKYTYNELSNLMGRTVGAIQRRCIDLNIKDRPIRIGPCERKWKEADISALKEMILAGYKYENMTERINKSTKAIRGKVYNLYKTERLDLVRERLRKEAEQHERSVIKTR